MAAFHVSALSLLAICLVNYARSDNVFTIFTPSDYTHQTMVFTTDSHQMVLGVMACMNTHIFIYGGADADVGGLDAPHSYEIVLGAYGDQKTTLRKNPDGEILVEMSSYGVLTCDKQTFWVMWEGGVIAVGPGGQPGHGPILSYTTPGHIDHRFISMSTGPYVSGTYEIVQTPGEGMTLYTSNMRDFAGNLMDFTSSLSLEGKTSVVFTVTTCSNAHFALMSHDGRERLKKELEFVIKNNATQIVVLDGRTGRTVQVQTVHMAVGVSCDVPQAFWLHMDTDDQIWLGQGSWVQQEGTTLIHTIHPHSTRPAVALAFASYSHERTVWKFMTA